MYKQYSYQCYNPCPLYYIYKKILTMKLLLGFMALVLISACSINSEFYFDKDFSGKVINTIDMSSFMAMAGESTDSIDMQVNEGINEKKDSILDLFNSIEGVSNADMFYKEGVVQFSYDFEDVEALNRSGRNMNSEDENLRGFMLADGFFEVDGDELKFTEKIDEDSELLNDTAFTKMLRFMEFSNTFYFEKPVKSFSNTNYLMSQDKRELKIQFNGNDLLNNKKSISTQVNF